MEDSMVSIETKDANVNWIRKFEKKCLRLTINGHLDDNLAREIVSKWKDEMTFNRQSDEKVNIICNCRNMTGYDTDARKLWQQTISDLKTQIKCMWIITDNKLFKMAINTMGLVTKFNLKTANSESEICEE